MDLLEYVSDFRRKILKASKAAKLNLKRTQGKMKQRYDKNTTEKSFKPGDKVLALLPIPGWSLQARCFGALKVKWNKDIIRILKKEGLNLEIRF